MIYFLTMESRRKKPLLGVIVLLLATVIWGLAYIAQSDAMQYLGVLTYSGVRVLVGGIALVPVVCIMHRLSANRTVPKEQRQRQVHVSFIGGIVCGIFMCAAMVFQQYGIAYSSVGKSGFLTALYIVLVPVCGILFGRRVTWLSALCVAIALVGSYFLCVKEDLVIAFGDWMLIGDAVLFAFQILFIDRFLARGAEPVLMTCIEFWTAGLLLLPLMFLVETPTWGGVWAARVTILYAGLASGAVGYTMQMIGQREMEPTAASLLMSLESVFAALFGWLLLGEQMQLRELFGCALVFLAVILSQLPIGRQEA
ncbi:MAG: DMT family transporter [Clostridia bacterium]|nr:DMT family transporter [Clostridia bacterium]